MSNTFGAPAAALVSAIVPGFESSYVRPIFASVKSCSGFGNTFWLRLDDDCGCLVAQEAVATAEARSNDPRRRLMLESLRHFSWNVTLSIFPVKTNGSL